MFSYYKRLIFVLFLILSSVIKSNADNPFKSYEDSLKHYFSLISTEKNDQKKLEHNNEILRIFREIMQFE